LAGRQVRILRPCLLIYKPGTAASAQAGIIAISDGLDLDDRCFSKPSRPTMLAVGLLIDPALNSTTDPGALSRPSE